MFNIVQIEVYKLLAKKKIYIFMGILLTLVMVMVFGLMAISSGLVPEASELNNINGHQFVLSVLSANLQMILPVFLIVMISDIVTEEYKSGTFKLPLIHPVNRAKYLTSKVIGVAIVLLILQVFTLIVSYSLGGIFFGLEGYEANGIFYSNAAFALKAIFLYMISILPVMAFGMISLFISLQFSSGGAVVGSSIGLLFIFFLAGDMLKSIRPYIINSHFGLFALYMNGSSLADKLMSFGVIFVYLVSFYLLSIITINKKDILT